MLSTLVTYQPLVASVWDFFALRIWSDWTSGLLCCALLLHLDGFSPTIAPKCHDFFTQNCHGVSQVSLPLLGQMDQQFLEALRHFGSTSLPQGRCGSSAFARGGLWEVQGQTGLFGTPGEGRSAGLSYCQRVSTCPFTLCTLLFHRSSFAVFGSNLPFFKTLAHTNNPIIQ